MKHATLSLLMLALALPMPIVALAQDDEEAYFEEVIVTATRREGAMMDVTQSIQAVGEEQLELPTLSDLSEVHNLIPGAVAFGNKAPTACTQILQHQASRVGPPIPGRPK